MEVDSGRLAVERERSGREGRTRVQLVVCPARGRQPGAVLSAPVPRRTAPRSRLARGRGRCTFNKNNALAEARLKMVQR